MTLRNRAGFQLAFERLGDSFLKIGMEQVPSIFASNSTPAAFFFNPDLDFGGVADRHIDC